MKDIDKLFNFISIIGGFIGGFVVHCFGGFDVLLWTVLIFSVLDYLTGWLKARVIKNLSSEIGFKGIIKKVFMYVAIVVAVLVGNLMNDIVPLREVVISFFICNEGLSILENIAEFVNVPQKLKDTLLQLRDKE